MTAPQDSVAMPAAAPGAATVGAAARRPWRRAAWFILIGLALYAAVYAWSEALVYRHGQKNRFFMVHAAPAAEYDYVVLGASHAMTLDFEDMNAQLEAAAGARILNLSIEGGGILPSRVLLDYFLAKHRARNVLYVLDSFAFYSAQWNEQRLADAGLLRRAPFDPALVATLWRHPWTRPLLPEYVTGFGKINNPKRFEPDIPEAERNLFRRTYRPVASIDRQRMAYLYPARVDPATFERYFEAFRSIVRLAKERGAGFVVVKPPLPARILPMMPGEAAFDERIKAWLDGEGVAFHDFTRVSNRDNFFYNTDHLNREGVSAFIKDHLGPALAAPGR